MSAALPMALRARFQEYIEGGLSGRAAAARLKLWECLKLCVSGLTHAGFRYGHALKRSSNKIANWFRAAIHS